MHILLKCFSSAHGTFFRINHMLGHKTSLNTFKKIEIISSIFSNHNGMKLEVNHKKKEGKTTKMWTNNKLLNHNGSKKSKKKLIPRAIWKQKYNIPKTMGCSKSVIREKITAIQSSSRNKKNLQINNLTSHLKKLEEKNDAQS